MYFTVYIAYKSLYPQIRLIKDFSIMHVPSTKDFLTTIFLTISNYQLKATTPAIV